MARHDRGITPVQSLTLPAWAFFFLSRSGGAVQPTTKQPVIQVAVMSKLTIIRRRTGPWPTTAQGLRRQASASASLRPLARPRGAGTHASARAGRQAQVRAREQEARDRQGLRPQEPRRAEPRGGGAGPQAQA